MSLSREDLLEAFRANRAIALPYFGGCEVELFFEDEEELGGYLDPLVQFLRLTEADRPGATPHVVAYFQDVVERAGFDWTEPGMRAVTAPTEDIWRFVYPTTLTAQEASDVHDQGRECRYVVVEGNCGWEEEHGIMLAWREGKELVKVSSFDGHPTNGHAYADATKDAFIYHGSSLEASTRNPGVSRSSGETA